MIKENKIVTYIEKWPEFDGASITLIFVEKKAKVKKIIGNNALIEFKDRNTITVPVKELHDRK